MIKLAVFHNETKKLFLMCDIHDTASEEWSHRKPPGFQELVKISYDT